MPVITVTLIEGYDGRTRRDLSERLTDAARAAIGAPLDGITVMIHEVAPENYMRGRKARVPGTPPRSASQVVRDYLAAMEQRDLSVASSHLADGFTMTFPGGAVFSKPAELMEWAGQRYLEVAKTYEGFDEATGPDGVIVYCFGTLSGLWLDGTRFEGIRFIDRFTVAEEKIRDQRVWNDIAEMR